MIVLGKPLKIVKINLNSWKMVMRGRFIDLTGERFGRLTVLCQAEKSSTGILRWKCLCDCGKETVAQGED